MKIETELSVATWNVHRSVGADGKADAVRTEQAITDLVVARQVHVLALQEADSDDPPHAALLDMDRVGRETGLRSVHGPVHMRFHQTSGGYLGNILLVGDGVEVADRRIIELPGHCPRAAVLIETRINRVRVRFLSCHLSLSQLLRATQLRLIGQVVARRDPMQTVVLGDLNEWRMWGGMALSRRVSGLELHGPTVATFPTGRPILPLDRILSENGTVRDVVALDGRSIRAASDHRPLVARVAIADRLAA